MAISHVTAGTVALAAEQNALIDQSNATTTQTDTNTGDISDHETRITDLETPPFVPRCVLEKNVDQTIGDAAGDILLTWQVEVSNNNTMHQGDTIVVPEFGEYLLSAQANIRPGGTTAGDCCIYITRNGLDTLDNSVAAFSQPSNNKDVGVGNGLATATIRQLDAGDVLRVQVFQKSGIDRDASATAFGGCTFAVSKQSERS